MKRIALITPSLTSGGAQRVAAIWASELSKINDNVFLIVIYKKEGEYETYGNVKKIYLYESYEHSKSYSLLSKINKIRSVLKENKIDAVIPFLIYIGLMTTAASAFLKTDVIETLRIDPVTSPKNPFLRILRDTSVRLAKRCIVQNEEQKKYFSKRVQKKMGVFSNPLHPSVTKVEKQYTNSKALTFITAGRMEEQKNHKLLSSAFKLAADEYPEISLKIYGTGSMHDELCRHIEELGMQDKITLCGRTDDIPGVLSKADAFVLSSDFEGMPNALLEAMAVGLPSISTDCPTGPSDIIENGKNGILTPVGDVQKMADAIKVIAADYKSATEMGKRARKFALEKYDASVSAKRLLSFIENM